MEINNALAGIAVSDVTSAIQWYQALFERPPDTQPMAGVAEWEFNGGGWIQVFKDVVRAGHSSITLVVPDIDTEVAKLRARGIMVGSISESDVTKTALASDPDGNQLIFAEPANNAVRLAR